MAAIKFEDYAVLVENVELAKFEIGKIIKDVVLVYRRELCEDYDGEMVYAVGAVGHRDAEIIGYSPIVTEGYCGNRIYLKLKGVGKATRYAGSDAEQAWADSDARKASK